MLGVFGDLQGYCRDQAIKTWRGVKEDENTFSPPERRMWEVSDYFETQLQCSPFWERPQRTSRV